MDTLRAANETALLKHYRGNFICHCLDGTLFIAGINFVSLTAILPVFVSSLSHSSVLVGLLTTVSVVGSSLPQLVAANRAAGYERNMDLLLTRYAWGQRIPWLLMALNAFFVVPVSPGLGLGLFFVLYAIYSVSTGLTIPLWFDIVVKSVPVERRGRMLAARWVCSGIGSVAAAYVAARLLKVMLYPTGYAVLFLLAFVSTMLSLAVFSFMWEPKRTALETKRPMMQYLGELPGLLREDRNFTVFLAANAFIGFSGMAGAFYTICAIEKLQLGVASSGAFGAIILASQTVSSLAWGSLADRYGYKLVLQLALVLSCFAAATAAFATHITAFYFVFALFGAAAGGTVFSGMNIITEMCTPDQRPTYVGLANTLNAPIAGLSPLLGGLLVRNYGYQSVFLVALFAVAIGLLILSVNVKAVRHTKASAA